MRRLALMGILASVMVVSSWVGFAGQGWTVYTAVGSNEVHFVAQGTEIQEMRVEVFTLSGQRIFDSGLMSCSSLAWNRLNTEGQRVANGVYLYAVTVRDSEGKLIRKLGKLALLGSSGRQTLPSSPTANRQTVQNANGLCLSRVSQNSAGALLVQALADAQVQQLRQQLEAQGLRANLNAAKVFSGGQNVIVSIPFDPQAELVYMRTSQGSSATAVTTQGRRRIHQQASGVTRSQLLLNWDQTLGILQQISGFLRQYRIRGWVNAVVDENRQEILLIISEASGNQLIILEARSWSESGAVTVGAVKRGPIRSSCSGQARPSNRPQVRLLPLAQMSCFTDGMGEAICGPSPRPTYTGIRCLDNMVCWCWDYGYGLETCYCDPSIRC